MAELRNRGPQQAGAHHQQVLNTLDALDGQQIVIDPALGSVSYVPGVGVRIVSDGKELRPAMFMDSLGRVGFSGVNFLGSIDVSGNVLFLRADFAGSEYLWAAAIEHDAVSGRPAIAEPGPKLECLCKGSNNRCSDPQDCSDAQPCSLPNGQNSECKWLPAPCGSQPSDNCGPGSGLCFALPPILLVWKSRSRAKESRIKY